MFSQLLNFGAKVRLKAEKEKHRKLKDYNNFAASFA